MCGVTRRKGVRREGTLMQRARNAEEEVLTAAVRYAVNVGENCSGAIGLLELGKAVLGKTGWRVTTKYLGRTRGR